MICLPNAQYLDPHWTTRLNHVIYAVPSFKRLLKLFEQFTRQVKQED